MKRAFVAAALALLAACSASPGPSQADASALRTGVTAHNGNCAIDSAGKLTGQCVARGEGSCLLHAPEPMDACPVGAAAAETRPFTCSDPPAMVSREYTCAF